MVNAPRALFVAAPTLVVLLSTSFDARAELRAHALGGAAAPLGGPQASEYGAGGAGALVVEVPLHAVVGAEVSVGGFVVSKAARPADPALADHGSGSGLVATAGVRVNPLGLWRVAGPWADVGGGVARTGSLGRPALEARAGWDFRLSRTSRWDFGPFIGYTHVFQPEDALRPEDARIAIAGVAFSFGAEEKRSASPPPHEAAPPPAPPPEPSPEPVVEAPSAPPDRDGDGIADADDACPDVPGLATEDPATNGCPASEEGVRIRGDKIVLDEIIHFDNDSPRVRHVSWPIVKKVADLIVATPDVLELEIEGHADHIGTAEHNYRLSVERAQSVKRLLVQFGVDAKRITVQGFGFKRPRVQGVQEEQRAQNRRVEFTITKVRSARVGTR